ncbi:MAG TPA: DUF4331 domain-containing protein [Gaiellaceae bacterium]|nr:DUF4331 domain-containing protein [Gaiellaceae bacterium]
MTAVLRRRRVAVTALALFGAALALLMLRFGPTPSVAQASSHREAPLIANDPTADITDFYMFRSIQPGQADKVDLIMNVIPFQEPSGGPNYYNFDPSVVYTFHVDNNKNGTAGDVEFEFRFSNETRGIVNDAGLPLAYVALPPITSLSGPGSEGLGVRQRYSLTMIKDGHRIPISPMTDKIAVPSNVGPRTMPDYDGLAGQGTYDLGGGIKVFAGQRDDPFFIDLGAAFDTLNLRSPGTDMLSGFNVNSIVLEVPAALLTRDHRSPSTTTQPKLGAYASTSRPRVTVRGGGDGHSHGHGHGGFVQVQRLANPLINELIIGTKDKDRWNSLEPQQESAFLDYYENPRLALALSLVFGAPVPATPRSDLENALLKYAPGDMRLSELLRLDVSSAPGASWPNGRKPADDVTDTAIQVVGGVAFAGAGDNVSANDKVLPNVFPYLASPWDGRNRVHLNP